VQVEVNLFSTPSLLLLEQLEISTMVEETAAHLLLLMLAALAVTVSADISVVVAAAVKVVVAATQTLVPQTALVTLAVVAVEEPQA
jgi:hypothetical protein